MSSSIEPILIAWHPVRVCCTNRLLLWCTKLWPVSRKDILVLSQLGLRHIGRSCRSVQREALTQGPSLSSETIAAKPRKRVCLLYKSSIHQSALPGSASSINCRVGGSLNQVRSALRTLGPLDGTEIRIMLDTAWKQL